MASSYITKPGDTISKIMEKVNCSFKDMNELNNIPQLSLIEGQMILVPISINDKIKLSEYVTEKNDNLDNIQRKFSVVYDELSYFNNITNLILTEKQTLLIEQKIISPVADEFLKDEKYGYL